jgi:hypothetical protein
LPPAEAAETLRRDARSLTSVLETLERLEARMVRIQREFREGERAYTDPEDDAEIRRALLTYLTARRALFRLVWFYREGGRPEYESRAFLLAYTAAVELVRRGMQFVEEFDDDAVARRKLNEGDAAWELPESTYERIRTNLASREVLDALTEAAARFEALRAEGRFPADAPWSDFAARAAAGSEVAGALAERLWSYKWDHALERARRTVKGGSYAVSSLVSTWIGDARLRERPEGRGLVSPGQLEDLRTRLRPGDILIERRNWYLSNAFLPGFWPHSAIWFGGPEGLEALGIENHPDVAPVLPRVRRPDEAGHERVILEAVSEGVILTSLEHSIGEADAVCVFRPRGTREEIAAAVARAFRHHGKPYDFDFDFFSTDRLVCTELVYQAYEDLLDFDLVQIMGRETLPAVEIVRKWAAERSDPAPALTLVAFLDADEAAGRARPGGPAELVETLGRPGLTFLQAPGGRPLLPFTLIGVLFAALGVGLLFLRRRAAGQLEGGASAPEDGLTR